MPVAFSFLMMQMLEHIRSGVTEAMSENYNTRIADLFLQLADRARNQSRLQSFLYYGRREAHFSGET